MSVLDDIIGGAAGGIIREVGEVADELFTSDEERLRAEIDKKQIEADVEKARLLTAARTNEAIQRVNEMEAQHASVFVAGWRPAVGWIAAAGLGFNFILQPLLVWGWSLLQARGFVPAGSAPPDALDISDLIMLLMGMLGMGGLRTYEKTRGVARDALR